MFQAFVLKVFIATPGDTGEEVEAVVRSLHRWNGSRAEPAQAVLLPRHWKSDAVPRLGRASVQGVINEQLLDNADIVLAVFDSRLGQATADAVSATAGEIQRAIDADKHVHVWFSREPFGRDADLEQIAALRDFQNDLQTQGLLGDYSSPEDLGDKVRNAIEHDVAQMGLGLPDVRRRGAEHARPRARRAGGYLVIKNHSESVNAEQFRFICEGVWPRGFEGFSRKTGVDLVYDGQPFDLLADSDRSWSMSVFAQSPPELKVTMRWMEGDESQEVSQNISLEDPGRGRA